MDWNKEIKGPKSVWLIVAGGIVFGSVFCLITISRGDHNVAHLVLAWFFGVSCFVYLCLLAKLAKNPSPWLRRNIRLIATIGGLINAALILWAILSKNNEHR
jgi:hypothetical protein